MKPPAGPRWVRWRGAVELASFILANSYFLRPAKGFCYPVLNCWACPGANFACPIGALQYSSESARLGIAGGAHWWSVIPIYALGTLIFFGGLLGRMTCGWLCPFGWFQELLGKLSRRKLRLPRSLSYLRYVILVVLVFILPYYTGQPWFTKLCPQGALQGGLTQPLIHPELRALVGGWWVLKQAILAVTIIASIFMLRPFCGVICPLGAIFSLFNRISAWQIRFDREKCVNCLWCVRNCPQGIDPRCEANGHACVSCMVCQRCPYDAIYSAPIWQAPRHAAGEAGGRLEFAAQTDCDRCHGKGDQTGE